MENERLLLKKNGMGDIYIFEKRTSEILIILKRDIPFVKQFLESD